MQSGGTRGYAVMDVLTIYVGILTPYVNTDLWLVLVTAFIIQVGSV